MLFTFGAAYSAEEKSCADKQKREIKKQGIDKLNIFTTLKFPDITESLVLKYKYPAARHAIRQKSEYVIFIAMIFH